MLGVVGGGVMVSRLWNISRGVVDNRNVMVLGSGGGGVVNYGFVGHLTVIYWGDCRVVVGGGRRVRGHVVGRSWAWHGVDSRGRGRSRSRVVNSFGHRHLLTMAVGGATYGDLDMAASEGGHEAGQEEGEEKSLEILNSAGSGGHAD